MLHLFSIVILTLTFIPSAFAASFWGDKTSQPVDTVPYMLRPGQFIWKGDAVPFVPTVVVVSLPEQKAYVYQ
jgi:hypothetical protein